MRQGEIKIRVRYCECDPMGIAHHSAYVPWLEMGRTELLRSDGVAYKSIEESGLFLAVIEVNVKYKRRINYDDVITINTTITGGSYVKVRHEYELYRGDQLVGLAHSVLACVNRDGQVRPLPDVLVQHAKGTLTPPDTVDDETDDAVIR
ncbi:MAG: acyl-CoA thioesterase [Planctomycetes bacterium]|nr:acyl-CoA thioesterase [Planctomycetota bacterium]NOG53557.1 acyl-CoA thioesterase [Planctomycetota bacterium]